MKVFSKIIRNPLKLHVEEIANVNVFAIKLWTKMKAFFVTSQSPTLLGLVETSQSLSYFRIKFTLFSHFLTRIVRLSRNIALCGVKSLKLEDFMVLNGQIL